MDRLRSSLPYWYLLAFMKRRSLLSQRAVRTGPLWRAFAVTSQRHRAAFLSIAGMQAVHVDGNGTVRRVSGWWTEVQSALLHYFDGK